MRKSLQEEKKGKNLRKTGLSYHSNPDNDVGGATKDI